jgi:hypothetical protein
MADVDATNHGDVAKVEKHGRDRSCGSKNKPKSSIAAAASSLTPTKCCPGRPLGSKNKKSSLTTMDLVDRLDVSVAHPILPSSSSGDLFYFFSFAGAQCHEQQRLPLKFTEFMEGREFREAILRETSSGDLPYELEVYYDGNGDAFFRGGWDRFAEDHDLHQGWILMFDYHHGTAKFDIKIFDGTQCQNKYNSSI